MHPTPFAEPAGRVLASVVSAPWAAPVAAVELVQPGPIAHADRRTTGAARHQLHRVSRTHDRTAWPPGHVGFLSVPARTTWMAGPPRPAAAAYGRAACTQPAFTPPLRTILRS